MKARGGGKGDGGEEKEEWEKQEAGVKNLLVTLRVICLEGDAPSSTRDVVTRPKAGLPPSSSNAFTMAQVTLNSDPNHLPN